RGQSAAAHQARRRRDLSRHRVAERRDWVYFIGADDRSPNPSRSRVRPPSFCNLQALPQLIKGHMVADVVALIGSIDVVLGEVGRQLRRGPITYRDARAR